MEFQGMVALVTGAGSGIGKASALTLAARGAFVGLLGRTEEELREVLAEIQVAGGDGSVLIADISDTNAMRDALEELWGR